eukprot:gene1800-942_t
MSEEGICSRCQKESVYFNVETSSYICESCGTVQSESNLKEHLEFNSNGQLEGTNIVYGMESAGGLTSVGHRFDSLNCINYSIQSEQRAVIAKKKALSRVEQYCSALSIPARFSSEIFGYVSQVCDGKFTKEKWTDKVIGCCIYIVARKNNLPLTFLDLSETLGISIYKLGRRYREISKELNVNVSAVDPYELLDIFGNKISLGDTEEKKNEIISNAARIIRVAKIDWINQGRRPGSIAGAAIKLSCDSLNYSITFSTIADGIGSGQISIRERYKEIQQIFIKLSSSLPWNSMINLKNLSKYLPFLLNFIETLQKLCRTCLPPSTSSSDQDEESIFLNNNDEPPSFIKLKKEKERRKEKVKNAKNRIENSFKKNQEMPSEELDFEDLEIEKLLLAGAKESDLEEGYFHVKVKPNQNENVNEEELNEKDLSEKELANFIKTPAEIEMIEKLRKIEDISPIGIKEEENPKKKRKLECE